MSGSSIATILYPPPGSPVVLQAAAIAVLALHVGGGIAGILSGFTALLATKGRPIHRLAGRVFLVSMLTMGAVAACVAPFMASEQWSNTIAGVVTCYFVLTGWAAARRPPGRLGRLETAAVVVPFAVLLLIVLGFVTGATGRSGAPAIAPYLMGSLAALALASDLRVIWRRGVTGGQRLARHLWRLCAALLIATGSALAQPRLVPPQLSDTPFALLPIVLILGVMIFWLLRLLLARQGRTALRQSVSQRRDPAQAASA
jgi:uncharacterized membrane protein